MSSFLVDGFKIPKNVYPFLDQISNFEKKPIVTDLYFNFTQADPEVVKMIEDFFKYPTLKEALKNTFGISSPKVCDFVNQNMIVKDNPKQIGLNLNYFLSLSCLYYIFLKQEKPNHDGFLKALENHHIISLLSQLYNQRVQVQGFMNKFSEDQKLKILENSGLYDEIEDTLAMYFQRDDFFQAILDDVSFEKKNTFQKVHDLLAKHLAKITQEDFVLDQEKKNPKLANLSKINEEYSFVLPRSHHDLVNWGAELGHCIGSRHYAEKAFKGQCVLLGVFNDKRKLKYTLEVINGNIYQAQGVSGSRPDSKLMKDLEKALKSVF